MLSIRHHYLSIYCLSWQFTFGITKGMYLLILVYSYCVLILEVEVAHTITMLEKKYTAFRNKAVSIKKELIRYFDHKKRLM